MKKVKIVRSASVAALLIALTTTSAGVGQDSPMGYAPATGNTDSSALDGIMDATDPRAKIGTPVLEPELLPAIELDWINADLGQIGVVTVKTKTPKAQKDSRVTTPTLELESMHDVFDDFLSGTFAALNYPAPSQTRFASPTLSGAASALELGLTKDSAVTLSPLPKTVLDDKSAVDVAATFEVARKTVNGEILAEKIPLPRRRPAIEDAAKRIAAMSEQFGIIALGILTPDMKAAIDIAQIEGKQGPGTVRIAQYTLDNLAP